MMTEAAPVESPRNTNVTQGIGFDARPAAKRSVLKKMVDYGACLARMLEVTSFTARLITLQHWKLP